MFFWTQRLSVIISQHRKDFQINFYFIHGLKDSQLFKAQKTLPELKKICYICAAWYIIYCNWHINNLLYSIYSNKYILFKNCVARLASATKKKKELNIGMWIFSRWTLNSRIFPKRDHGLQIAFLSGCYLFFEYSSFMRNAFSFFSFTRWIMYSEDHSLIRYRIILESQHRSS